MVGRTGIEKPVRPTWLLEHLEAARAVQARCAAHVEVIGLGQNFLERPLDPPRCFDQLEIADMGVVLWRERHDQCIVTRNRRLELREVENVRWSHDQI